MSEDCPICLMPMDDHESTFDLPLQAGGTCGHTFHKSCLLKASLGHADGPNCPVCRTPIPHYCTYSLLPRVVQSIIADDAEWLERELSRTPNLEEHVGGITPLTHACRHAFVEGVKLLLKAGANPNATSLRRDDSESSGFAPLTAAVLANSTECVDLLLEAGATLEKTVCLRQLEFSPLVVALDRTNPKLQLFHHLLKHCAISFPHIQRAFAEAALHQHMEETGKLLERGAIITDELFLDLTDQNKEEVLKLLLRWKTRFETPFAPDPAFGLAVHRRDRAMVKMFMVYFDDWERPAFTYFAEGGSLARYTRGQRLRHLRSRSVMVGLSDGMGLIQEVCDHLNEDQPTHFACPIVPTPERLQARKDCERMIHVEVAH